MQTYRVTLTSPVSTDYYCQRAADSVSLNTAEKSKHELEITVDLETPYSVGLILGASGSGKTTLAKEIFGQDCFQTILDPEKPILEQFPEHFDYDTRVSVLSGIGLTQVPCWVRPVKTLSNGQKARAEAALLMCREGTIVIDEWTSVVDRTVAKVMSHCLQKHARTHGQSVVVLSCHYDVIEWLNPDWVIDCNTGTYARRGLLQRTEQLNFQLREIERSSWKYFSKYHYLSKLPPPGFSKCYGLFDGNNQIGFTAFSSYVPYSQKKKLSGLKQILHANRTVIHPDYCGFGLGIKMVNAAARLLNSQHEIWAKFSSIAMYKSRIEDPLWQIKKIERAINPKKYKEGSRFNVKTYSFKFKSSEIE